MVHKPKNNKMLALPEGKYSFMKPLPFIGPMTLIPNGTYDHKMSTTCSPQNIFMIQKGISHTSFLRDLNLWDSFSQSHTIKIPKPLNEQKDHSRHQDSQTPLDLYSDKNIRSHIHDPYCLTTYLMTY